MHASHAEQSRDAIIRAAEKLFVEKGFAGTSMSSIAREAGVTQSLIHYHFHSKADLWSEVKSRLFEHYRREQIRAFEEGTGERSMIEDAIRRYFRFLRNNPAFVRLIAWHSLEAQAGEVSGAQVEGLDTLFQMGAEQIRGGQERGEVRADIDPILLIHVFISACESWFFQRASFCGACAEMFAGVPMDEVDERFVDTLVRTVLEGVRPR